MNINDSFFNKNNKLVFKQDTSQSVNIMSLTHALILLIEYTFFFFCRWKKNDCVITMLISYTHNTYIEYASFVHVMFTNASDIAFGNISVFECLALILTIPEWKTRTVRVVYYIIIASPRVIFNVHTYIIIQGDSFIVIFLNFKCILNIFFFQF